MLIWFLQLDAAFIFLKLHIKNYVCQCLIIKKASFFWSSSDGSQVLNLVFYLSAFDNVYPALHDFNLLAARFHSVY